MSFFLLFFNQKMAYDRRISDWSADVCSSDLPEGDIWTPMDQLAKEFEAIGFYLSAHPLDAYQATLNRVGVKRYADVLKQLHSSEQIIKIAGTIISKQERTSQKTGNSFAFVQCSDASGMFEVMLFSEILTQHRDLLEIGRAHV